MSRVSPLMLYRSVWSAAGPHDESEFRTRRSAWHEARRLDAAAELARRRGSLDELTTREAQRLRGSMAQYLVTPLKSDIAEVEKLIAGYGRRILELSGETPLRTGEGEIRSPGGGSQSYAGWDTSMRSDRHLCETIAVANPGPAFLRCLEEPPAPSREQVVDQGVYLHHGGDPSLVASGLEMVGQCSLVPGFDIPEAVVRLADEGPLSLWRKIPSGGAREEWMFRVSCRTDQPDLASALLHAIREGTGTDVPRLVFVHNTVISS